MGCNNTKNATVHVQSETNLGSEGSSQELEEKGSDEELFIKRRTWGSPAPPLPNICGSTLEGPQAQPLPAGRSHPTNRRMLSMEKMVQQKGGSAFVIQDENSPALCNQPPRRLQALKGAGKMSMEELIRKQREHEEKRQQILREQTENLSREHSRLKRKKESLLSDFEIAQRLYMESENRLNRVSKNREGVLNDKIKKVRDHNKKVVARKRSVSLRDTANDNLSLSGKMEHDVEYNKSESESWADNDSIKNIYDQMEFITPASGLASAVTKNNHSDDEFFS